MKGRTYPVQGTMITEWKEGAEVCEKLLATRDGYLAFASKMVRDRTIWFNIYRQYTSNTVYVHIYVYDSLEYV